MWFAVLRLPARIGMTLGVAVVVGLDVAAGISGASATAIVAITLLCALLGFVAFFLRESRLGQARTERLLAELEDAREQQLRAAAIAERSSIAGELHDVLAHSLSGAAIQLQGARLLAEREHASPELLAAIERAGALVRGGLGDAREAVGALRGELPGVERLDSLVVSFRDDLDVDASFSVEGERRPVAPDVGLVLYRGAQEALTNVARHAPGARTTVVLRYDNARVTLRVENGRPSRAAGELENVGGGRGLTGLGERLARVGGSLTSGATDGGWLVELAVPA
jgi:signal transduction histidine kinase